MGEVVALQVVCCVYFIVVGQFGVVRRGERLLDSQPVAIKVMPKSKVWNSCFKRQFCLARYYIGVQPGHHFEGSLIFEGVRFVLFLC